MSNCTTNTISFDKTSIYIDHKKFNAVFTCSIFKDLILINLFLNTDKILFQKCKFSLNNKEIEDFKININYTFEDCEFNIT